MYVYTVYIYVCIYIYEWIHALLYMFEEYVYIPHVSPDFWGVCLRNPQEISGFSGMKHPFSDTPF